LLLILVNLLNLGREPLIRIFIRPTHVRSAGEKKYVGYLLSLLSLRFACE
jgi:hypothetical protein